MQMEEKTDRRRVYWSGGGEDPSTRLSHCIVPSLPFNHVSCVVNTTETSHLKMGDYWDLDWIDRCACMDHLYIYIFIYIFMVSKAGRPRFCSSFVLCMQLCMQTCIHSQPLLQFQQPDLDDPPCQRSCLSRYQPHPSDPITAKALFKSKV